MEELRTSFLPGKAQACLSWVMVLGCLKQPSPGLRTTSKGLRRSGFGIQRLWGKHGCGGVGDEAGGQSPVASSW